MAVCASEEGSKEAKHGGSHYAGQCTHRCSGGVVHAAEGLNAECQCQGQCNNTGCDASEYVTFQVVCLYQFHYNVVLLMLLIKFDNCAYTNITQ